MLVRPTLGGTLLLALTACTTPKAAPPAAPTSAATTAAAAATIEATYQRYDDFIRQVNGDSLASLYTADGQMIGTNAQGPAEIAKFFRGFANVKVETQNHQTDAITVADSLAVHWGRYRQRAVVGKQPPIDVSGRFVIEWHLQPDGRWLIRRLMTLPDPAKS